MEASILTALVGLTGSVGGITSYVTTALNKRHNDHEKWIGAVR